MIYLYRNQAIGMIAPADSDRFPWQVLTDEAVDRAADDYFQIHTAYARLLLDIARKCATPFSIGLYSSWGSGKTSVAKILQGLVTQDKPQSLGFVYLDVWKYSSDPLKRWILLETEKQLEDQGILDDYTFEGRGLQNHLEFEEKWEDKSPLQISLTTINTLGRVLGYVTVFSIPIYFFSAYFASFGSQFVRWLSSLAGLLSATSATGLLVQFVAKKILESMKGIAFTRTTKHVSAKPAFSSEKFGSIFQDLVTKTTAKLPKTKIIFVFDNLDRCTEAVAVEAIAVLKTYLDEPGCVYVIPCDQAALVKHISKSYVDQSSDTSEAAKYANEFLNKFFQMTLRLPAPADIEIDDYIDKQLQIAGMTDLTPEAKDVLSLGYRGETPRQVKRVLNDLIGYRALANQVESSGLIEAGALTAELPVLTKMCVISVHWPDFLEKLSDDPELWNEVMEKIDRGEILDFSKYPTSLTRFLNATRHVSPEADIRPYLFLKRVKYEKDLGLKRKTEQHLKNGETDKFMSLFTDSDQAKRDEIAAVAVSIARKWLEAERLILLENSGPSLVKAALTDKADRDLIVATFDLLEYVCQKDSPEGLEKVFPIADIVSIVSRGNSIQKRNILMSYGRLLNAAYQLTPSRLNMLKTLLDPFTELAPDVRAELAGRLTARYQDLQQEPANLELLETVTAAPSKMAWLIQPALLGQLARQIDFSKSDTNMRRMKVLVQFQEKLSANDANAMFAKVAPIINSSRTRSVDQPNEIALDLLSKLHAAPLTDSFEVVQQTLIEQTNAHAIPERADWLRPLLSLYPTLSTPEKERIASILNSILADPTDVNGLVQMLNKLGIETCGKILDIPVATLAIHSQAAALQQRFGLPSAKTHREQILECFPPLRLLSDSSLFSETLIWDLCLYAKVAERTSTQLTENRERITSHVLDFCRRFVAGRLPTNAEVYDTISAFISTHPDLLNSELADLLARCGLDLLVIKAEEHFKDFRTYSGSLSGDRKRELVAECITKYIRSRGANWTNILGQLISYVKADRDLSSDSGVVAELVEFAFEAAKDNPNLFSEGLVQLIQLLDSAGQQKYTAWALDKLISYEGSGIPLAQMEPFLRLTEASSAKSTSEVETKLKIFAQRMLSAAKGDQEKIRTLTFLSRVGNKTLLSQLHHELETALETTNEEIKRQVTELLG
jgi:hypothetical protein